jgi:alkylresorcinol/alkylpyrone synthase
MGWEVEEDGLKARFAQSIPSLVASDFASILSSFLERHAIDADDIDGFACHPGGAKVLDALEDALGLERGALKESRSVLRDFGNMSAATVMFVLERMDWRKAGQRLLMTALGPGFSSAFLVLES